MAYLDDAAFVLNIQPIGLPTIVRLSQNENGRRLYFAITGNESAIPSGVTVTLSGTKPDGVVYSKTGSITNGVVLINEDMQLTAVAGNWDAKIKIVSGGQTVATGRVRFIIDADPVAPGSVPSDSQLEGLVAEAEWYAENARSAAYGSPLVASTVAGMTDHTRVYVYTGSETGYTAGNWYYWSGSAWTSGGVYNSTALQTDTTLAIPGMAADAKATGDAIDGLDTRLDTAEDDITDVKSDLEELEPISEDIKVALLACFEHVTWIDEHGQDYYDALHDALYGSAPQWLLEWSYADGSIPTTYAPDDWGSSYGFGEFVANKGVYITFLNLGSKNLYPKNYETSSDSEYELKFNFVSLPTNNGLVIRLGNGTTGMQVTVNSNGISIDNGTSFLPGITIESNKEYVIKAIHSANGCSLYLDNVLIWTGQSANIGNKKNHILVTIPSGSMDLYISEIKFNTTDSFWDYEWDASSMTLPEGMTADYYDFTTESGAMFAKTPNLDFDCIGNCVAEIEMKAYSEDKYGTVMYGGSNPQFVIKNAIVSSNQFRGTKLVLNFTVDNVGNNVAIGINGTNSKIPEIKANDYHVYNLRAENNVYSLSVDGEAKQITQNNNTSPYFPFTGVATAQSTDVVFYGAFIKSIKFKRL